MPVIGEGTYGCVHSPSLKCKSSKKINYTNQVSKTLKGEDANDELKELSLLKKIDTEHKYYLGYPEKCIPSNNKDTIDEIAKCNNYEKYLKWNKNNTALQKDTRLLIMKNGGASLEDYVYTLSNNMIRSETLDNIEVMFINFINIIRGVKFLIDNKLSHRDLKEGNIVYNEETQTMRMIDFGMLAKFSKMKKEAINDDYFPGDMWWSVPIYATYLNKNRFDSAKYNLNKNFARYSKRLSNEILINISSDVGSIKSVFFKRVTKEPTILKSIMMKELNETYKLIETCSHNEFIEKYCKICDVHNLGLTLLSMLTLLEPNFEKKNENKVLSKRFLTDIRTLGFIMVSANMKEHIEIDDVLSEYERILESNNYLSRNGYRINRDKMAVKDNASPEQQPDVILVQESPRRDDSVRDLLDGCPDGKERNPNTKRCVNKCKSGYVRDKTFKCKSTRGRGRPRKEVNGSQTKKNKKN